MPSEKKRLFLTFDDGPDPETTPALLELLEKHQARGTFFLTGKNALEHPKTVEQIQALGHTLGHHSFSHLNAFSASSSIWMEDVKKAAVIVPSPLFRPPYGKIKPWNLVALSKLYQIVLWDVLSGDFDERISSETCFQNVIKNSEPGSIIVFHDSKKAAPRMFPALEKTLIAFSEKGYTFEALPFPEKDFQQIMTGQAESTP